jgi:hypothetical protein
MSCQRTPVAPTACAICGALYDVTPTGRVRERHTAACAALGPIGLGVFTGPTGTPLTGGPGTPEPPPRCERGRSQPCQHANATSDS